MEKSNAATAALNKYGQLVHYFQEQGSALVAFSFGVDSTFLLNAAHHALGQNVVAVTVASAFVPKREVADAIAFCKSKGIRHEVIEVDALQNDEVAKNPTNRCYLCKKDIFSLLIAYAKEHDLAIVAEGSNLDDLGDYRPGLQAVAELGIKSPLREVGFTKSEIRDASMFLGLPTWDKPSFACLASRFPYGERLTAKKLTMVDDAEQILMNHGFKQLRVRVHEGQEGNLMARLELLPEDLPRMMEETLRTEVYQQIQALGFAYVTLDLRGYRMGSMNETLK